MSTNGNGVSFPEGIRFDVSDLEEKWNDQSPDYPACAVCGQQIGSPEEDEEREGIEEDVTPDEGPAFPIRVWRPHPDAAKAAAGELQELAFHWACVKPRLEERK